ncbi:hypothetical protein HY357_02305 [Candidatus Roizmanbacteria bacterium]|nr:hypothetical protein [Candidatus Roizmanbacteria bacterium]
MKKETSEYKAKTIDILIKEAEKLRTDIAKETLELKVKPLKDTNSLLKKRKKLALILTILTEKKDIEKLKK